MTPPTPLRDRVATATNAVLKLASEAGATELVARITTEAELWGRPEVTVVIIGEPQSGKSSLVNSLLGQPLLPAGPGDATATYVVLRHGDGSAYVQTSESPGSLAVALDELGGWITSPGGEGTTTRSVDIRVAVEELESGLVLVDTPGIGSVHDAGGRISLSACASADALLFVVDAGAPISALSLHFLSEAAERVDTILLALTKVDRFRGWRQVASDDRDAITAAIPHLAGAPLVPVSNRLKRVADELAVESSPNPQMAEESGVPALLGELRRRVVSRKQNLRMSNLLRVDASALDEMAQRLAVVIEGEMAPSALTAAVARDQAELDDLRIRAEQAQIAVSDGFANLRDSVTADANLELRKLAFRLEEGAAARGAPPLSTAADLELRALDAELSAAIATESARLAGMAGELLMATLEVAPPDSLDLQNPAESAAVAGSDDLAARLRVSMAGAVASSGTGMALFASRAVVPTGPDLLMAVFGATAAMGIIVAGLNLRMMKRQQDQQAVRKQVQAMMEIVRTAAPPAIRQRVLAVQRHLEAAIKAEVRGRTAALQRSISEGTQLARADSGERQQAAALARSRTAEIDRIRQTVAALQAEVRASP